MKKLFIILIIIFFTLPLTACGDASSQIVGRWEVMETPSANPRVGAEWEFFSDGVLRGFSSRDRWHVDGSRIRFDGHRYVKEFSIRSDTLTIYDWDRDGGNLILTRIITA